MIINTNFMTGRLLHRIVSNYGLSPELAAPSDLRGATAANSILNEKSPTNDQFTRLGKIWFQYPAAHRQLVNRNCYQIGGLTLDHAVSNEIAKAQYR